MSEGLQFGAAEGGAKNAGPPRRFPLRDALLLFFVFLFVVSNIFVDHVLTAFSGAVRGRTPENFGIVIQGVALVILYALSRHVADSMEQ